MRRIALHSVPRSGSTWLGNIYNSHPNVVFRFQPLFSYAFKGALSPKSSKDEILRFFEEIKESDDDFLNQRDGIKKGIIPEFQKAVITHICYKEVRYHHVLENMMGQDDQLRVVGLIRSPLAVIQSWLDAPKEFRKELGWRVEEEWKFAPKKNLGKAEEFNGYEKWKETALLFEKLKLEFPERFYLVKYDDLLRRTNETVANLFAFCGLELTNQTRRFLTSSRNVTVPDAYGVFKERDNDDSWKKKLPQVIVDDIKKDKVFQDLNSKYQWI